MMRQFAVVLAHARDFADNAEQMAQAAGRTRAAAVEIDDHVKVVREVVSPLVKWLKSARAGTPSGVQALIRTEEME